MGDDDSTTFVGASVLFVLASLAPPWAGVRRESQGKKWIARRRYAIPQTVLAAIGPVYVAWFFAHVLRLNGATAPFVFACGGAALFGVAAFGLSFRWIFPRNLSAADDLRGPTVEFA